jgi:hypothetical protein
MNEQIEAQPPTEQRERKVKPEHLEKEIARTFLELMANAARVAAGAGNPFALMTQLLAVARAWREYDNSGGRAQSGSIIGEALRNWHWPPDNPEYDEIKEAERKLCRAALRIVAARWIKQSTQEHTEQSRLYQAADDLEKAQIEQQGRNAGMTSAEVLALARSLKKKQAKSK